MPAISLARLHRRAGAVVTVALLLCPPACASTASSREMSGPQEVLARWLDSCEAAGRALSHPDSLSDSAAASLIRQLDCPSTPVPVLGHLWREWAGGPEGASALVVASVWATDPGRSGDTTLFRAALDVVGRTTRPRPVRLAAMSYLATYVNPHAWIVLPPAEGTVGLGWLNHAPDMGECDAARIDEVLGQFSALAARERDPAVQRSARVLYDGLTSSRRC